MSEDDPRVYDHAPDPRPFEEAKDDPLLIERITQHIAFHLGPVDAVLHEPRSHLVHIDVHVLRANAERDHHLLVTSGMSGRPMSPPDDFAECLHSELLLALPRSWPLDDVASLDAAHYWPIRWLQLLARFPHQYGTWLYQGHTVPNGEPPEPVHSSTELTTMLLVPPTIVPAEFAELELEPHRFVSFFALWPIHTAELALKLREGTWALVNRLREAGVTDVWEVDRPSAV